MRSPSLALQLVTLLMGGSFQSLCAKETPFQASGSLLRVRSTDVPTRRRTLRHRPRCPGTRGGIGSTHSLRPEHNARLGASCGDLVCCGRAAPVGFACCCWQCRCRSWWYRRLTTYGRPVPGELIRWQVVDQCNIVTFSSPDRLDFSFRFLNVTDLKDIRAGRHFRSG
jgi:hypothetical protein